MPRVWCGATAVVSGLALLLGRGNSCLHHAQTMMKYAPGAERTMTLTRTQGKGTSANVVLSSPGKVLATAWQHCPVYVARSRGVEQHGVHDWARWWTSWLQAALAWAGAQVKPANTHLDETREQEGPPGDAGPGASEEVHQAGAVRAWSQRPYREHVRVSVLAISYCPWCGRFPRDHRWEHAWFRPVTYQPACCRLRSLPWARASSTLRLCAEDFASSRVTCAGGSLWKMGLCRGCTLPWRMGPMGPRSTSLMVVAVVLLHGEWWSSGTGEGSASPRGKDPLYREATSRRVGRAVARDRLSQSVLK